MKKLFLSLFGFLVLVSCGESAFQQDTFPPLGFDFRIDNKTNTVYSGRLFIGGVKDSVFVPTESIPFHIDNSNKAYYYDDNNQKFIYFYSEEDEENIQIPWQPDLDVVKKISDKYYFLLKLSEDRQEIIKWGGDIETAFRMDTKFGLIGDFSIEIAIREDGVTIGNIISSTYRVPNDTVRVLPENYEHEPL